MGDRTEDLIRTLLAFYYVHTKKKAKPWLERQRKKQAIIKDLIECEDISNLMDADSFYKILKMVKPHLKAAGILKGSVTAEACLVSTLLYLITGKGYQNLKNRTLICTQLLEKIVPETLGAIWEGMKYFMIPASEDHWQNVVDEFEKRWQFKNCAASISARHISIAEPSGPRERKYYLNPQGKYSFIWIVTAGANYQFLNIETNYESNIIGGEYFLTESDFYRDNVWSELPEDCPLPGSDKAVPYVTVGDGFWPLDDRCMTPYLGDNITEEERAYNYRLNRARHVVDNAIGVLTSRFQILTQNNLDHDFAGQVIQSCCLLHNFLLKNSSVYLVPEDLDREDIENGKFIQGKWRNNSKQLQTVQRTYVKPWNEGEKVRNDLKQYFNSVGKLPFQEEMMYVVPCIEPMIPPEIDGKMDVEENKE